MPRSTAIALLIVALCIAACGGAIVEPDPTGAVPRATIPRCEDVPPLSAPAAAYRDTPIYVGNEMPVDDVREWAVGQPGYEDIWIDRDHNGWVAVAFSRDAAARQADLEREFPGVGVVAVPVDWTNAELEAIQAPGPRGAPARRRKRLRRPRDAGCRDDRGRRSHPRARRAYRGGLRGAARLPGGHGPG